MTKEQLASEYAKNQLLQFSEAIEQAYLKGYEQCLFDNKKVFNVNGVEYVDMSLPSGTLWSRHPMMLNGDYLTIPYNETAGLPIPTKEQWEELIKNCALLNNRGFHIIAPSPSSERIHFDYWRKGLQGEGTDFRKGYHFWLKGADVSDKFAPVMICCVKNETNRFYPFDVNSNTMYNTKDFFISTDQHFTGFRLPVFLVKSKGNVKIDEI